MCVTSPLKKVRKDAPARVLARVHYYKRKSSLYTELLLLFARKQDAQLIIWKWQGTQTGNNDANNSVISGVNNECEI